MCETSVLGCRSYSRRRGRAAGAGAEGRGRASAVISVDRRAPPPPWATNTPPRTLHTSPGRTSIGSPQVNHLQHSVRMCFAASYTRPHIPAALSIFKNDCPLRFLKRGTTKQIVRRSRVHVTIITLLIS